MGNYSYGDLRYKYKINIDLEDLIDKILSKIGVEGEDWYLDDTSLVIEGWDRCRYKHWHCDATRYEPSEDETEMFDSLSDKDIEQAVTDAMTEFKEYIAHKPISTVDIDEKSFEYDPDEPDPDAAYERWRDREFDE